MNSIDVLRLERGFWYLATPYTAHPMGMQVGFQEACTAAARLIARGVTVFSPIAHSHPIASLGSLDPTSHDLWLPLDEQMMEAAHGIIVLEMRGWDQSRGVAHEIKWFDDRGRVRVHLDFPALNPIMRKQAA